jgi:hypothetical protein
MNQHEATKLQKIEKLKTLLRSIFAPDNAGEIDRILQQAASLSQQLKRDDVHAAIDAVVDHKLQFGFPDRVALDKIVSQPAAEYLKSVLPTNDLVG